MFKLNQFQGETFEMNSWKKTMFSILMLLSHLNLFFQLSDKIMGLLFFLNKRNFLRYKNDLGGSQ